MIDPVSAEITDLDYERIKVQHLAPQVSPVPFFSISTIAPADFPTIPSITNISPSKPQLEHPALPLIRTYQERQGSLHDWALFLDQDFKLDLATRQRLETEKEAAVQELIKKEKSRESWNMATTVVQYLASATSTTLGIACIATGQVPLGITLLVGGVSGIAIRAAHDLDAFQKIAAWISKSAEVQEKIAHRLEMGAIFLSLSASLAGGFWAYGVGALSGADKLAQGAQTGLSIMGASFRLKEGYLQKQIAELQQKNRMADLGIDFCHKNAQETISSGQKMVEEEIEEGKAISRTIQNYSRAASAA